MRIKRLAGVCLASSLLPLLSACGEKAPPSEMEASITICRDVMTIHTKRMQETRQIDERSAKRLIDGCRMGAYQKKPELWQCVLKEVKEGGEYLKSADKCFGKS